MYSIIDIETTGGAGRRDKITEIAIFVFDGEKVVDSFVTLINPEIPIPSYITNVTGIDTSMVSGAPKFYEVAKKIVEITEGTTFVAHNVNFDYSFVKDEFKRLGYNYNRKRLCTVKLARKYLPGHESYSLGKLCKDLDIPISARHRAAGDAEATVKLFDLILKKNNNGLLTDRKQWVTHLPQNLNQSVVENLPEETGVYYFYNSEGKLIYVGKSKNIYSRVLTHLGNVSTKKALRMKEEIADVGFEVTGSELIALLLESEDIKKNKPLYNVAQRKTSFLYGIHANYDFHGYLNYEIVKNKAGVSSNLSFSSKPEAVRYIDRMIDEFHLCPKLCGIYKTDAHCFNFLIEKCHGACICKEPSDSYNKRASKALDIMRYKDDSFAIIEAGRNEFEKGIVLISDGKYQGYGYFDSSISVESFDSFHNLISHKEDNRDIRSIINAFLTKYPKTRIVKG